METKVEIEVSARHIHLSKTDFCFLFDSDSKFVEVKELSQSNEFTTDKTVKVIGPDGELDVRFLSPFRGLTQVELSLTDCYEIGIRAPYETNVADGASEIIIKGDQGEIKRRAAIIATRHLHANSKEAKSLGLVSGQLVKLEVETRRGKLILENIVVKIANNYNLRVHLDTDEGNASGIDRKCYGKLIVNKEETTQKCDTE